MDLDKIIKGCVDNNRKAQEALYRYAFPYLRGMCLRYTTDDHRVLSIINDGMLKVFKHISQYDPSRSLDSWIRTIVFRCLSDHFRKENVYFRFLILEEEDNSVSVDLSVVQNLHYEDLRSIIDLLPTMSRKVFLLYAIEGYTHKEIAAHLHISDGTSKWHLSEARKRLRKIINNSYKEYSYGRQ